MDIPAAVAKEARFESALQNSDRESVRVKSDQATQRGMLGVVQNNTQIFKLFADDPDFRPWLMDTAFQLAYDAAG